jgi:hypothetical protein
VPCSNQLLINGHTNHPDTSQFGPPNLAPLSQLPKQICDRHPFNAGQIFSTTTERFSQTRKIQDMQHRTGSLVIGKTPVYVIHPPASLDPSQPRHRNYDLRGYNARFWIIRRDISMEAERLNQIKNRIADLDARTEELRRYL